MTQTKQQTQPQTVALMSPEEIQERAKQMMKDHHEEWEKWECEVDKTAEGGAALICICIRQLTQATTFWLSELAAQQAEINERNIIAEEKIENGMMIVKTQSEQLQKLAHENQVLTAIVMKAAQEGKIQMPSIPGIPLIR